MKYAPTMCRSCIMIGFAIPLLVAAMASGQPALDAATLQSLRTLPASEVEKYTKEWVDSQVAERGRDQTAEVLAQMVVVDPAMARQAFLIRGFGKSLEPEFSESILRLTNVTNDPLVRGGLLQLLRDTAPENAPEIARFLTDLRPGEDLVEQSKTEPKLRESIASGAVPLRVCDMAFNVILEITATDETKVQLLTRSQSIDSRNVRIDDFLGVVAPSRTRPVKRQSTDLAQAPEDRSDVSKIQSVNTPSALDESLPPETKWGIIAATLVVVIAVLAWWFKCRK